MSVPALRAMFLKAADLFRLNIDHPHLPMLCFISVGDGPLLPRGSQLEGGVPWKTQNWEVGGEGSERPRTGHHSQEKEGLHLQAQAETRKWEERGARKQTAGKAGSEIFVQIWALLKVIKLSCEKHIHSFTHQFIHSLEQEAHIEYILCTRHKPVAMGNTQTLTPGLTYSV